MQEGHSERMRRRIEQHGLESLADHEILEYLLYSVHARGDTNEIAHNLLNSFHTLSNVFDADPAALMAVKGVGPSTAQLLSILPALFRVYVRRRKGEGTRLFSVGSTVEWLEPAFYGAKNEITVLLCLDSDFNLIHEEKWSLGSAEESPVSIRELVAIALKYDAVKVIFSHNHLTNIPKPSTEDTIFTADLKIALERVKVVLMDHLVLCPNGEYYSFRAEMRL